MTNILTVATAGLKPGQLQDTRHSKYPRVDYLELRKHLSTDIISYDVYPNTFVGPLFRQLETQLRSDLFLAGATTLKSRHYKLVFAMSERAGIPIAGLKLAGIFRLPLVTMFQSWSDRQERVITKLNLFKAMDAIIVHCQSMKHHLISLGAPENRTFVINYSVDQQFFAPQPEPKPKPGFIFSLGEIRSRDYSTLFKAVESLPVDLLIAASGAWYAREKVTELNAAIPNNVRISSGLSSLELKELYTQSQFVVLPVYDTVFSAGATVSLETACMGKAVIATRSRGISDYIVDGETGILVEPGNVDEWCNAIQWLLTHPEEAQRMGTNARRRIENDLNLENYVKRIAQVLNYFDNVY